MKDISRIELAVAGLAVFVSMMGCQTTIETKGSYDAVWSAVVSGLNDADFYEHETQVKWATGFEPETGRLVARRWNNKFDSDLVDVTITPTGDDAVVARTVGVYGWEYNPLNLFLAKSWQPSAQADAAEAIRTAMQHRSDVLVDAR